MEDVTQKMDTKC